MGELRLHFARSTNELPSPFIPLVAAEQGMTT